MADDPRPLNPHRRWETPIDHDFTPVELAVARAGYGAFTQRKTTARPWDTLHAHERFRWCLAAELVATHGHRVTAAMIRSRYYVLVDQRKWDQVATPYLRRWEAIQVAMLQARTKALAGERTVASA